MLQANGSHAGRADESRGGNRGTRRRRHGAIQDNRAQAKRGDFEIRGDVSSQFVSALMLAAPTWEGGMRLRFTTPLVSRPYVEMTASIMRRFGISVCPEDECVSVEPGCYLTPQGFNVEPDWSAAGFFYEAASLRNHPLRIAGLAKPEESLQGDSATATFFDLRALAPHSVVDM